MNPQILIIALIGHIAQALYSDVIGYQRARSQWREDARTNPIGCGEPPTWDWPLCWSRIAGGAIAGLLTAMGINVATQTGGAQ